MEALAIGKSMDSSSTETGKAACLSKVQVGGVGDGQAELVEVLF